MSTVTVQNGSVRYKTIHTKSLSIEWKVAHLTATIELHFMDFQGF